MADELHPELDGLRAAIWDASELSSPIVFRCEKEPAEHVRLLMRTLGVPVEVGVVGGRTVEARAIENGFAHQDYRTSRVRAIARIDAGEDPRLCIECATELDTETAAHDPQCSLKPPPAGKADVAGELQTGRGKAGLERGRDGRLRSKKERSPDGTLTGGEMQRRHDTYVDGLPMLTRCAVDDCSWQFEGTALEARAQAAAHRAVAHPELGSGRRKLKPGQGPAQVRPVEESLAPDRVNGSDVASPPVGIGSETEEAGAVGSSDGLVGGTSSTLAERNIEADIPEPDIAQSGSAAGPARGERWTRELVIAAIQRWHRETGSQPKQSDWMRRGEWWPAFSTAATVFGSWSEAIKAAGFEPLRRGRQPGPKVQFDGSDSSTSSEVAKQEVVQTTGRGGRWTRETVIERIMAWAIEHDGQPPSSTMWIGAEGYPSAAQVKRLFDGSWADAIEAAGFPRPTRGTSHRGSSTLAPVVAEGLATWHIKVPGTGLRYRDSMEAYVAADEIEADGERVAEQARYDGNNGKADQALDASRELAEKIRIAARLVDGEPPPNYEPVSRTTESPMVEPIPEQPGTSGNDRVEPIEAPPGRLLPVPLSELTAGDDRQEWLEQIQTEAARLEHRARALRKIGEGLQMLEEAV